jgi:tetratricopeptide (TPR) repeat protein
VVKGDNLFGQKDYYKAKESYQQALGIFPAETYPKERITRITSVIDSIYRANKGFYDKAIADGDKYFTSLIFDKAIDAYNEAAAFLPMEAYPKEMIAKIKKTISENAIVDVLNAPTVVAEGIDKQFSFTPVNMASRKNNYLYIKVKNLSKKTFNVLVRYGKDKQPSGGAVIKNLAPDGVVYDRLISVRDQDPWYREDNNWISLYPQGGDIEVSFIQISRSQ